MKRLNRIARKITALNKQAEQFIQECEESGNFNDDQMKEIRWGFEEGLSIEQVKFYANSKFNDEQMDEIREGFENGLSMEQVKFYAKSELNSDQMFQIRKGFENKLTMEQIKLYAKPEFNWRQMSQIYDGFEELTIEQVKLYADPKFDWEQMEKICENLENGVSFESINYTMNRTPEQQFILECENDANFNDSQIYEIKQALNKFHIPLKEVKIYAKPELSNERIRHINNKINHFRLSDVPLFPEEIELLANPKFDSSQLTQIERALEKDNLGDAMRVWAKPEIPYNKMRDIREDLQSGIHIDKIKEKYNL